LAVAFGSLLQEQTEKDYKVALFEDFSVGLFFWQLILFLVLLFVLRKFAWKPILGAVEEREKSIEDSLASAEKARAEMERLQSDNERILAEARAERDVILKEAREIKEKMIGDAKTEAGTQAEKIIANAKEQIHNEKMAAVTELKNQVAEMSIEIAEMVLRRELDDKAKQGELVKDQLDNFKLN
jgi:F-type H+-transporting ATPase subunit b